MIHLIFLGLIAAVLFWVAAYGIPSAGFAQPVWLGGKRVKRVLREGLQFVIPLLQRVPEEFVFSRKPQKLPIEFRFFTRDPKSEVRRELILSALVLFRDDPNITTEEGYLRRTEITPEVLADNLTADVKSIVGRFGGLHSWDVFIKNWKEVERYLNGVLRLHVPPHVMPQMLQPYLSENHADTELAASEMEWENRLQFYKDLSGPIGNLLRDEHNHPEWRSEEEALHGIDILGLSISNIDFAPESKRAIEEEGLAVNRIAAAEILGKAKQETTAAYEKLGLEPRDALDAAERDLNQITATNTYRVQGFEGIKSIVGLGGNR